MRLSHISKPFLVLNFLHVLGEVLQSFNHSLFIYEPDQQMKSMLTSSVTVEDIHKVIKSFSPNKSTCLDG